MTNRRDDEIVEEIRRRREAHAASFGYDFDGIVKDLQRQERESGVALGERPPRTPAVVRKGRS
ncbi:MAG: hypothetical protein HY812_12880 [Planctomycetes bacterium]|nr:hypothetical protein [Planctomycetota bacterium]